jgi:F-type H+-transporting ATPase subunit epsilon
VADQKSYLLEIVTPQKKIFSSRVAFAVFPAIAGEIGVLPHHTAFLSPLRTGAVKIVNEKGTVSFTAVGGGFIEVSKNNVSLLAETAEFGADIDTARAKKSQEEAESQLSSATTPAEIAAAKLKLVKAVTRLSVAKQTSLLKIEAGA